MTSFLRLFGVLLLGAIAFGPGAADAAQTKYRCIFTKTTSAGPIPEEIRVTIASGGATATVFDEYTRQLDPAPLQLDIGPTFPNRTTLKWKLRGVAYVAETKRRIDSGVIDYELNIRLPSRVATLKALSRDFGGVYFGEGTCGS